MNTLPSSYDQRGLGVGGEIVEDSKDQNQGVLNSSLIPYLSTGLSFNRHWAQESFTNGRSLFLNDDSGAATVEQMEKKNAVMQVFF